MTITDFLQARIAEDLETCGEDDGGTCDWLEGIHFDRTRSLAECEAKRRIVEEHEIVQPDACHCGVIHADQHAMCGACYSSTAHVMEDGSIPCLTLLALASVYADHPDYNPEWAK